MGREQRTVDHFDSALGQISSESFLLTGYFHTPPPPDIPEPGSLALLGIGTIGAAGAIRLRLEDEALLVGAIASFAAIAAVMYFTRQLNWYASLAPDPPPPQ